jgi:alcohol dehydrogenase class IV
MLPYSLAYNAPVVPQALAAIARALGVDDAVRGLHDLATKLGAPRSLAQLGMPKEGLSRAVDLAMRDQYWNPRQLDAGALAALLNRAYKGGAPVV